MPRTFSRGEKVTSDWIFYMTQFFTLAEGQKFVERSRFLNCPEKGLIERDILPFLKIFLPDNIRRMLETLEDIHVFEIGVMNNILEELDPLLNRIQIISPTPGGIV